MLNFCINTEFCRIRGHNKTIFTRINGEDEELVFNSIGQAASAMLVKGVITQSELLMIKNIASDTVISITDLFNMEMI